MIFTSHHRHSDLLGSSRARRASLSLNTNGLSSSLAWNASSLSVGASLALNTGGLPSGAGLALGTSCASLALCTLSTSDAGLTLTLDACASSSGVALR